MKKMLITGIPKSGKSALLESVLAGYPDRQGFITWEMQEQDDRLRAASFTAAGEGAG